MSHLADDSATRRARAQVPLRRLIASAILALALALVLHLAVAARWRSAAVAPPRDAPLAVAGMTFPFAIQGSLRGLEDASYRVSATAAGFEAMNSAQRLAVSFDRAGVRVSSAGIRVGVRLRATGYGAALAPLPAASPTAAANRVNYERAGLSEWYRNGPLGVEQGFTIWRAPSDRAHGPLTLALAVSGNARATLSQDARSLTLRREGAPALRYAGLSASDARGRHLRSWLELHSGLLRLRVDAHAADYPLRIDPFVQQAEALPGSSAGGFGSSLALSADGGTALVGAPEQLWTEANASKEGLAYVFTRSGSTWSLQGGAPKRNGTLATPPAFAGGGFGSSVALSGDGNTALIGSPESRAGTGLAWMFKRSGSSWSQSAKLVNNSVERERRFGAAVALSSDANTAAISAEGAERKAAVVVFTRSGSTWTAQQRLENVRGGIALSSDGSTLLVGATIFSRSGTTWTQQGAPLAGSNQIGESEFGESVALSSDGNTALIGGAEDHRCTTCPHASAGAAWVFTRSGSTWTQQGEKLTASGAHSEGRFGETVALSSDGNTALIGAPGNGRYEPIEPGAAFVFTRSGSTWTQRRRLTPSGPGWRAEVENGPPEFGTAVSLSSTGRTALVGANDFEGGWASVFVDSASVTSVSPALGSRAGGTAVAVAGSDLSSASGVYFGPTSAQSFKVNSDTSITAVSPAGYGTVDVTVALPDTSPSPTSADDQFTYAGGPQLGRCVASPPRKGEYKNAACTKPGRGRGKSNWLPGPGAAPRFTSILRSPAFEIVGEGRLVIACAAGRDEGQYTGPQRLRITSLVLSGCAESPSSGLASECQSGGSANGEIVANELAGRFGLISLAKKAVVGVDLEPVSGPALANFECGGARASTGTGSGTGTARELVGSVIGKIKSVNAMTVRNGVTYRASGGHQIPERFEAGVADTLTTLTGLAQTPEPTTFTAAEEVKYEERLEINTVV